MIAFVGFKGSGKDTAANYLIDKFGFEPFAFADNLKDTLAYIFQWPRDMLEGATPESRTWRERVDPWWADRLGMPNFTPRYAMQYIGTDVMRENFHDDLWIFNLERRLFMANRENVVVRDVRFPNEMSAIKRLGGSVIRVKRGDEPEWYQTARMANESRHDELLVMDDLGIHRSEWAWIGSSYINAVIENDGTIEELYERLSKHVHI
jgi:hypothetical protein